MEFCNKGMVRADPPPPQLWSKTINLHFFWTLPLGKLKTNKNKQVQLTSNPPPLMWTNVFFSPLFFHSFPIFRHIFLTLKVKKNVKSGLGPKPKPPPPPPCGLNPSKCVCFF